jgi:hypothetical protein
MSRKIKRSRVLGTHRSKLGACSARILGEWATSPTSEYSGCFPDVGTERKRGCAPLLALFEKWPAGHPAPEWFYAAGGRIFIFFRASQPFPFTAGVRLRNGRENLLRRQNCGDNGKLSPAIAARGHFSKSARSGAPPAILPMKCGPPARLLWETNSFEQLFETRAFMKTVETAVDPQK